MTTTACGIDIGGSGIKGGIVDLCTGELKGERLRIDTPYPATPDAVADTCRQVAEGLGVGKDMPIGVALPAPVRKGFVPFMANLDQSWVGVNVYTIMAQSLGRPVAAINDADAAGIAEVAFGAAKGVDGTVIVTTLGTGIGTAVFTNGQLLPNTELGHIEIKGKDAESQASAGQRKIQHLSFPKWAKRLQVYYEKLELLLAPDLFVIGGGVSRKHDKYLPLLDITAPMIPAKLLNTAGIVGAAHYAAQH